LEKEDNILSEDEEDKYDGLDVGGVGQGYSGILEYPFCVMRHALK
jgi:hypothetical protein